MRMWHYSRQGQQKGPVSEDELRSLAAQGAFGPDDLVWSEGMSGWQPARTIRGLQWPASPAPPLAPQQAPGAPAYSGGPPITNYLPWAIAATVLCCLPAGIVSIVYSVKASSAQKVGDYAGAKQAADSAKTWLTVAVVAGLAVGVVYFFLGMIDAMAQGG